MTNSKTIPIFTIRRKLFKLGHRISRYAQAGAVSARADVSGTVHMAITADHAAMYHHHESPSGPLVPIPPQTVADMQVYMAQRFELSVLLETFVLPALDYNGCK